MTITEFLLARIAEDEVAARAAGGAYAVRSNDGGMHVASVAGEVLFGLDLADTALADKSTLSLVEHVVAWLPGRVLAECEAKRALVLELARMEDEEIGWDGIEHKVMRSLALPYADHPDYREEWRP